MAWRIAALYAPYKTSERHWCWPMATVIDKDLF
jgi:hypothetical protein